jgi:hypothetical protein
MDEKEEEEEEEEITRLRSHGPRAQQVTRNVKKEAMGERRR